MRWIAFAAGLASSPCCHAQPAVTLDPVVVSATRIGRASFDLPASIEAVDGATLREGETQVNLSETLARIPGIVVQNRQNYAQDLQISSRGFGARTAFGVRGLRLIADGIPATMPDGQGQAASFDLGSASRIEVLRGPLSALYGNAAGGVIQIFTEDGPQPAAVTGGLLAGSYGSRRVSLKAGGANGAINTFANLARFETHGYREHSAAIRDTANAKLRMDLGASGALTLVANALNQADTQDPLGLSKSQALADPRQADATAQQFNTRKSIAQQQAGLVFERALDGGNTLHLLGYTGARRVGQYQAIPVAAQANPLHPGGVIDLDRGYSGADLRVTHRGSFAGNALTLTLGLSYDALREHRMGYQNFVGSALGVKGVLRRDEANRVTSLDQFVLADVQRNARWSLIAGVRSGEVKFSSADRYIAGANPDDSGAVRYRNTSPVLGTTFRLAPQLNVYASAGRGFETPTLNELAYRADGLSGLNFALRPSASGQFEIGAKALPDDRTRLAAALFRNRARDEIAVLGNSAGRSTFRNAGATRRDGAEISASRALGGGFNASFVYTLVSAKYLETFLTCTGSACTAPATPVPAGNRMPGVPRHNAYAELAWRGAHGGFAALEARASSAVYANDVNSEYAPGYGIANVRAGTEQRSGGWRIAEFVRVDNILHRTTIGSVIVGEANGRYYEPAPRRSAMMGISISSNF